MIEYDSQGRIKYNPELHDRQGFPWSEEETEYLIKWYVDRFLKLRENTFDDPSCYFHRYAHMPESEAISLAKMIWQSVNHVNLIKNILPCRNRANLILRKGAEHKIESILLRK